MRIGPAAYHRKPAPAPPPPSELGIDQPGSWPLDTDRFGVQTLDLSVPELPPGAAPPPPELHGSSSGSAPSDAELAAVNWELIAADCGLKKQHVIELDAMIEDAVTDRERGRLRRSRAAKNGARLSLWGLGQRLRGLDEDPVLTDYAALVAAVRKLEADAASAPSVPLRARLIEAAEYLKLGKVDMREPDFAEPFAECCPPLAVAALYSCGLDPDRLPFLGPLVYTEDRYLANREQRAQVAREALSLVEPRGSDTDNESEDSDDD